MQVQTGFVRTDPDSLIGCLTYQSRAVSRSTESELEQLVSQARRRNRSLGVTGMLLYDNGRFLQTLEGPPRGLKQVWSSICRDQRHCDIEVLTEHMVGSRLFSDWDLLLYSREDASCRTSRASDLAPHALAHYVPGMAQLALDGDDVRINARLASVTEQGWSADDIISHLIEPVARAMGDAWLADQCSEFELTVGLSMLQLAGHAVRSHAGCAGATLRRSRYSILLATAPGEPHMLSTAMLADQFTDAGWRVDMAFPGSKEALANQIAQQGHDAVDIALSDALPRPRALLELREMVDYCRKATPDNLVVVSVGGRMFAEATATAATVGADHARRSVGGTCVRLAQLIRQGRSL
ncbi:BLUF domain-containing protein [Erythrobacter tepidarius]|uniref:BLUF domain-containing protein n=1 Tax=Erythrobacter tepidarius TaxID=60454 RepID=UPI000A390EBB|nr:BLUF domain-containing protein [Erythrobacter tepidarius]